MSQKELNLGILAHIDAGKTTLTERLLYETGVIDAVGSVDAGTTQTDSLELERRRGITIKAAVASFAVDGVHVNLIDTPGHPDFIAEVERVLGVLDGAVLVVSAVEGVQPQTRVLMRALQRLGVPALIFVNKLDRAGADDGRVLREIAHRLSSAIVPMGAARDPGTRTASVVPAAADDPRLAEALAEHDEEILAALVGERPPVGAARLREALAAQTACALVHPVFLGSALTGAGVRPLLAAIAELLPSAPGAADGPVAGTVFKIERGATGEKVAYVRMASGTVRARDRVAFGEGLQDKVTAIAVFERGGAVRGGSVSAGGVAKLWGLREVRVGDRIGTPGEHALPRQFPPPTFESVVVARDAADGPRLRVALAQLAEQDPLIDVRQDDARRELSVSLYGEVQKEVIEATLADGFGLGVVFRETTPIHVERPAGTGEAVAVLGGEANPFRATIGLRVEPAAADAGLEFRLRIDPRNAPLYVYKTIDAFAAHMSDHVRETLREGLFGWQVTDCVVTMVRCGYSVPDGPPSRRGPLSTPADFRRLTPLVLMRALERATTAVCEPTARVALEVPTAAVGRVVQALTRLGAAVETSSVRGDLAVVETTLPATRTDELQRQLPRLTGGEGVLESTFAGYRPVAGDPPTRRRTTPDPLDLDEYMTALTAPLPR